MSVSTADFWKLLGQSRLLTSQQVQQLAADWRRSANGQAEASTKSLAEWLVARNALSRYQAATVLAGRAGPFFFGDYKVLNRIGQGRLAGCFHAIHTPTGQAVLLRFFTGAAVSDAGQWAAMAANARAACGVSSPYVQRFFEVVELPKFKILVSEDLCGKAVEENLSAGRFPAAEACRIARLAALGLAQMHERGRVHGDVRPANILLEPVARHPGHVKLLVEAHEAPQPIALSQQDAEGRLAKMADYLAPEFITAGRSPDPLTDIYALGCTLYTLLAGKPPFAGGSVQEKMARHASEAIKPLDALGVPQPLAQLVPFLMAKNPAVRHQSAALAAQHLAAFVEPAALQVQPPAAPATLASYEEQIRRKQLEAPVKASVPVKAVAAAARPEAKSPIAAVGASQAKAALVQPGPSIPATAEGGNAPVGAPAIPVTRTAGLSAAELIRRRAAAQRKTLVLSLVGAAVLAIAAAVGGVFWVRNSGGGGAIAAANGGIDALPAALPETPKGGGTTNPNNESSDNGSSAVAAASDSGKPQMIADDGATLWASPTAGQPPSFRCVPPAGQLYLIVRPADLLASEEGARVLAALGPAFASQREAWEAASGVNLSDVEQLILTVHGEDAKAARFHFVVKMKEPFSPADLVAKWGNPAASQVNSQTYYSGPVWSYYVPTSPEDARTFAMGEVQEIKEVAAAAGAAPIVFRDIERLRRATDRERHLTLLFYPELLQSDTSEALFVSAPAIREPCGWLLGCDTQAAAISLHCGEDFYCEMRVLPTLDKEPQQLADEVRSRLDLTPQAVESYIDRLTPPPFWSRLARRYPLMVGQLHQQMRMGIEKDQAIVNSVLPGAAAHNLVLGGELLVSSRPSQAIAAAIAPAAAVPQTIEEALRLKTTYTFDQQSLEFAMRDLAVDVAGSLNGAPFEFVIKLLGTDLEKDGITRNQSVRDFKQENQTVAEILTALVRKANPITTVKDPSEADQKLIWVIGPDPENAGKQVILITTRAAATAKKYKLPAVFVAKK